MTTADIAAALTAAGYVREPGDRIHHGFRMVDAAGTVVGVEESTEMPYFWLCVEIQSDGYLTTHRTRGPDLGTAWASLLAKPIGRVTVAAAVGVQP